MVTSSSSLTSSSSSTLSSTSSLSTLGTLHLHNWLGVQSDNYICTMDANNRGNEAIGPPRTVYAAEYDGGRSISSSRPPVQSLALTCNKCKKPLATTFFYCACRCIFCVGKSSLQILDWLNVDIIRAFCLFKRANTLTIRTFI